MFPYDVSILSHRRLKCGNEHHNGHLSVLWEFSHFEHKSFLIKSISESLDEVQPELGNSLYLQKKKDFPLVSVISRDLKYYA